MSGVLHVPEWFRRFGDIPGVVYASPEQIDGSSLAGRDDVPEVQTFRFDGELEETLSWPAGDGSRGGSASPVHYRAFSTYPDTRNVPAASLLRNVSEGLERPGEPSDYHFLIQQSANELWRRRRKEPELVGEVERLCWLDIGLIQARPDTWRPSRGTWCDASDGHRCRSLLEKAIDDWFTANSIPHECEPKWPRHAELNPSGAKRADWLLPDGTYVECAGMLESEDYAKKIAVKQQLSRALGLPLIVVGPTDMHRLGQIFGDEMQGSHS